MPSRIPKPKSIGSSTASPDGGSSSRVVGSSSSSTGAVIGGRATSSSSSSTAALSPPQSSFGSGGLLATTTATQDVHPAVPPLSLLSGALPRSLLQDDSSDFLAVSGTPARPRRLWTIQDTSLKFIPKFYPPSDPNCTVFVDDVSPSVVAIRISECCRKRSIAVEYDDESISATAMTVDRCQFAVNLWKGGITENVDFSDGVIVECVRVHGNTISFHAACHAILQAAQGTSTGQDDIVRRRRHSCLEFETLDYDQPQPQPQPQPQNQQQQQQQSISSSSSSSPKNSGKNGANVSEAEVALEHARELIKKDRWDTQLLGMECLANLTCPSISGEDMALAVSKHILQSDWLIPYIRLDESDIDNVIPSTSSGTTRFLAGCTTSLLDPIGHSSSSSLKKDRSIFEGRHETRLRCVALRVFCNSLSNTNQANILHQLLNSSSGHRGGGGGGGCNKAFLDKQILHSLAQDMLGATRPPSVVHAGYKLASSHEAALAVRCLRLMGEQSTAVQNFLQTEQILERLEVARACGRATHLVLQQESDRTYTKLTEDVRSC